MKRSLLIAGGTAGGLGAVLMVAPAYSLVTPSTSSRSTPVAVASNVVLNSATRIPTPTSTHRKRAAPVREVATKKVSGTFVGPVVDVAFGYVQVQIIVKDGKITVARALRAPTGRSDRYTQYALPILRAQTLAARGSNIQGASGASYTSYGWYTSLQAALAKAGL